MLFRAPGSLSLSHAIKIFVESALLYTSWVAICLITELANTNWNYAISDIVSTCSKVRDHADFRCPMQTMELAGICFDLIIIRICTGVSMETVAESAGTWRVADRGVGSTKIGHGGDSSNLTCSVELGTFDHTAIVIGKAPELGNLATHFGEAV